MVLNRTSPDPAKCAGSISRRRLLQTAVAAPLIVRSSVLGLEGATPPSDRIVLGGIGLGGRGTDVLTRFFRHSEVQFVAICDIRAARRAYIQKLAADKFGVPDVKAYHEADDLLARPDIDAVLIATGDRWHAPMSIRAAMAGKDIYCEKPCSMTIAESQAMAGVIRRYGRIYQAGTQRRNVENFILAIEMARSGKLGKLQTLHANTLDPKTTHEWLPAEPEPKPEEVDWNRWLGPCPWRPFNSEYIRGRWRGYFDFHGGGLLEWGSHTVDLCQAANNADKTAPVEYEPKGKEVHAVYANGVKLVMRDTGWLGLGTCSVRFEGSEGWVETGDTGKMMASDNLASELKVVTERGTDPSGHVADFLRCVKSREQAKSNADAAGWGHIACHASYIAWQLGRTRLKFDPEKAEFPGDAEANRMRARALREPWRV